LDKASINTVTGIVVIAPVISVFFGQLYYGERLSLQQKIAIFFIIAGVFVISYFRYY
jgi:drug/metabolite transporter (DMT)-like permease